MTVLNEAEKSIKNAGTNRGRTGAVRGKMSRKEPQEKKQEKDTTLIEAMVYEQKKKGANHYETHPMGRAGFEYKFTRHFR